MSGEYDFKRTSAQIETLLDKIPSDGNVAKVYQTTLSLNSIDRRDNKAATQAEVDEVLNVMAKYKDGYIVTVVEDNDYPYHYGVLNVGMMDDAMPITLIHYNDVGDVMAYMLESPSVGALWVVSNKTSSKVYVSPFKFNEVTSGSFLTEDQKRIITDINVNYEKGNIVLMSETSITNFKFGVINFAHSATTGTTLSIVNNDGDLIAYHLDGTSVGASRWTVTNKISGGGGSGENTLFLTTPYLLEEEVPILTAHDSAILDSLKGKAPENISIAYCGRDGNDEAIVPLTVSYNYSSEPMIIKLHFLTTYCGEPYTTIIREDENIVGQYSAEMSTPVEFNKRSITLNGISNVSDKNYQINFASISPLIAGWYIFDGMINYTISGNIYTCSFSIPMHIINNRPDRLFYSTIAACYQTDVCLPVIISFSSGNVFIKIITSISVSSIQMASPNCRLTRI